MQPDVESARQSTLRLAVLRSASLLGTPPSAGFDRLTRLAASLLAVPVSFFSLVDADCDFYVSQVGFGEDLAQRRELRGRTFCHYALQQDGPLVIEDTHADPTYRAVPTVDSLGVRAYIGIPVRLEGEVIGSMCVVDMKPRRWSDREIEILQSIADIVQREVLLLAAVGEGVRRSEASEAERKQLDVAVRASRQVLNAVSHDLRSPLSSLVLALGILEPIVQGDVGGSRAIAIARRQATHMQSRLDDLMDNARFAGGAMRLALAETDVAQLLQDISTDFSTAAEAAGVWMDVSVAESLPRVLVDPARMGQVLSNLVSNALKFTPAGGRIVLSARATPQTLVLEVSDTGRGIDPAAEKNVFEPFWQAVHGEHSGIGLGLHIAKSLVELHGGTIGVDRAPSGGACFRIEIPVVIPAVHGAAA